MFETLQATARLSAKLRVVSAIRIGAGRDTSIDASDLPVVRDLFGRPFIPGSSIKGVVRSYVERIVRTVACPERKAWATCNPTARDGGCVTSITNMDDQQIHDAHCPVCRLFGSPWLASKVAFADATVVGETWFGRYLIRDGVSIDRDTGTAADARKFDFEIVPGGTEFNFQLRADNASDRELGLLYLGISALQRKELALGGMTSRGPGLIELVEPEWKCTRFDPSADDLVAGLLGSGGSPVGPDDLEEWAREAIDCLRRGEELCTE
ncbi:MAG: CRISPR-associated RAMP protein [Armatimonadetes bacterium]|nr:CRISPR-associated RAMP protein [Armatimonadota bacterium]